MVVTPFLPGDSLLFGVGALAAVDRSGTLRIGWVFVLLRSLRLPATRSTTRRPRAGVSVLGGEHRLIRAEHLQRTEDYFRRYGGLTVLLSRFMPIIRTFAPFVAGIGRMPYLRFRPITCGGRLGGVVPVRRLCFGNLPWVRNNFGLVTLLVIAVSLLPLLAFATRTRPTGPTA